VGRRSTRKAAVLLLAAVPVLIVVVWNLYKTDTGPYGIACPKKGSAMETAIDYFDGGAPTYATPEGVPVAFFARGATFRSTMQSKTRVVFWSDENQRGVVAHRLSAGWINAGTLACYPMTSSQPTTIATRR
jgi:hypothetical protein